MQENYKYKIIKGEQDPYTQRIFNFGFESHLPGLPVSFNGKSYKVVAFPIKKEKEDFWIIELEEQ
jgi:hypothetical protein